MGAACGGCVSDADVVLSMLVRCWVVISCGSLLCGAENGALECRFALLPFYVLREYDWMMFVYVLAR